MLKVIQTLRRRILAKIAVELDQALALRAEEGRPGNTSVRLLAKGEGWKVEDVLCTFAQRDRAFEERHSTVAIALVTSGSFQYRASMRGCGPGGSKRRGELMTPGSLVLGNSGQSFECGHEHGAGDRCL